MGGAEGLGGVILLLKSSKYTRRKNQICNGKGGRKLKELHHLTLLPPEQHRAEKTICG